MVSRIPLHDHEWRSIYQFFFWPKDNRIDVGTRSRLVEVVLQVQAAALKNMNRSQNTDRVTYTEILDYRQINIRANTSMTYRHLSTCKQILEFISTRKWIPKIWIVMSHKDIDSPDQYNSSEDHDQYHSCILLYPIC